MRILIVLLFPIILLGQINTVCLNIEPNPNSTNLALSGFTKYINVLGELTGLGLEFNPDVLTRLDQTFIDLIAKGLNLNSESFRDAIQKVYNIGKG